MSAVARRRDDRTRSTPNSLDRPATRGVPVRFDDAAGNRQRQPHAPALLVERPGAGCVCCLYMRLASATIMTAELRSRSVSRRLSVTTVPGPSFSRRMARKMAPNAAFRRVSSPLHRPHRRVAANLQADVRDRLPHAHLRPPPRSEERGRVSAADIGTSPSSSFANLAQFGDERDETGARFFGLVHHFSLRLCSAARQCRAAASAGSRSRRSPGVRSSCTASESSCG